MNEDQEKVWKKHGMVELIAVSALVGGLLVVLIAVMGVWGWAGMADTDHLTNPDIPVSDLETNGTYTYTYDEIMEKNTPDLVLVGLGVGIIVPGYLLLFAIPSHKDLHKANCKGEITGHKYCPECGLKLSKLESK